MNETEPRVGQLAGEYLELESHLKQAEKDGDMNKYKEIQEQRNRLLKEIRLADPSFGEEKAA